MTRLATNIRGLRRHLRYYTEISNVTLCFDNRYVSACPNFFSLGIVPILFSATNFVFLSIVQVAQANDRALDAITKACDCYKEMRSLYQAGKMLEQAVLLCRDMNQFDKIGGFAERGALLYRQGKGLFCLI